MTKEEIIFRLDELIERMTSNYLIDGHLASIERQHQRTTIIKNLIDTRQYFIFHAYNGYAPVDQKASLPCQPSE
jgi:hypothetical protein